MPLEQAHTVLFDSSDVETGTAANPLRVDPTGTTTQPVSGTVTANQGTAAAVASAWPIKVTDGTDTAEVVDTTPGGSAFGLVVRVAGSVPQTTEAVPNASVSSVSVTTVATTILASNVNRRAAILWNDSGATSVFVKLGSAATTSDFSIRLSGKSEFELPFPCYTGIITGIVSAGSATVKATEVTT